MTTTASQQDELRAARNQRERFRQRSSIEKIHNSSLGLMAAIALFAAALQITTADAFVVRQVPTKRHSSNTKIFLEDWVANMIDGELYRLDHHEEYEAAWMEKNKGAVVSRLSDERSTTDGLYPSQMVGDGDREEFAQHRRDERMAFLKPEKYCADRCIATGNCDILEDFYEMGPQDVINFCEECVLNVDDVEDNIGCDVPDAFYEKEPPMRP